MRKLLAINFFPAFNPPASGGEMRYFYLYKYLSQYFDITLLSATSCKSKEELIEYTDTFREYRVPRFRDYDKLYYETYKEDVALEISGLVCALSAKIPQRFHEIFLQLQNDKDVIIHDHPYMFGFDLTAFMDNKPRIYNAYNVEQELIERTWTGKNAAKYKPIIQTWERELLRLSALCFVTSQEDVETFRNIYNIDVSKLRIVPNGIELPSYKAIKRTTTKNIAKKALFIGSLHPPNLEAVDFIINHLAVKLRNIEFLIVGNCTERLDIKDIPDNVKIFGKVNEEHKIKILSEVDLAINPMFEGSGTNLKMLEYFAANIPTITTKIGARGLNIENGKHAIVSSRECFVDDLKNLIENEEMLRKLSRSARDHVKIFSWENIAEQTRNYIDKILEKQESKRKKILVLNNFPISEPLSGGELRIHRIYTNLSKYYDICLLCFSKDKNIHIRNITSQFKEISIPKTKEHLEKNIEFRHYVAVDDIVDYIMASKNEILSKCFDNVYRNQDILIFSHPYMSSLLRDKYHPCVVYESHNVEYNLKRNILKKHPKYEFLIQKVKEAEGFIIDKSNYVICVSKDDLQGLKDMGASNLNVVQNGTDIESNYLDDFSRKNIKSILKNRPFVVFIGSGHPPNRDALNFIVNELSNTLPDVVFGIIGDVCYSIPNIDRKNVILFGRMDNVTKNIILELADIAINPMTSGSGSNLKMAEFFAHKIPTITTKIGGRGYDIINYKQAIICDIEAFQDEIKNLYANQSLRDEISRRAYQYAKEELDWTLQAEVFRFLLEEDIRKQREHELKKPKLIVDISFLKEEDWGTGIHRVVKAQLKYLKNIVKDRFVYPAFLRNKYYYASFKAYSLGLDNILMPQHEVLFDKNDILYMPDFSRDATLEGFELGVYNKLKAKGVKIVCFIHDILPLEFPQFFLQKDRKVFESWLNVILKISDKVICNSEVVANKLKTRLETIGRKNTSVSYVHLGCDIKNAKHIENLGQEDLNILEKISKPYFLIVSTIEPRKGHKQILKAFEILWERDNNINLVLIGKKGWMVEDIIDHIEHHPQKNKKLFWFGYVSDNLLANLYRNALAIIMASEGEGFGLPIIEAAFYKLPIIARDIPVFREIAKDGAFYFRDTTDPKSLAEDIEYWLSLYNKNKHPVSEGIKCLSWEDHVKKLLEMLQE
jgi:glycosyltransferase involved in cell wall biosynthesis